MNERIKELLEEAGVEVWYDDDSGQTVFSGDNVKQLEKFAELIVKETLQVARAGIEFGDGIEDAVYKYFGIEE